MQYVDAFDYTQPEHLNQYEFDNLTVVNARDNRKTYSDIMQTLRTMPVDRMIRSIDPDERIATGFAFYAEDID